MSKGNKGGNRWFNRRSEQIVLSELKSVWALGGTDEEACFYAKISVAGLQRYFDAHPELREQRDSLKKKPILLARRSVVEALQGDPALALKFLERKLKDEFSLRQEFTGKDGKPQEYSIDPSGIESLIDKLPKDERKKYYALLVDLHRSISRRTGGIAEKESG